MGRGEIPWGTFLDSTNVEIEKWVSMIPQNGRQDDDELPAVQIALKIQESDHGEVVERERKFVKEVELAWIVVVVSLVYIMSFSPLKLL